MRPVYGLLLVPFFMAAVLVADFALDGGFGHSGYTRVKPDEAGMVRVPVGDLEAGDVRFYRFLNAGNQEVKFFVGRDPDGAIQVAFDANEICYKTKRGYRSEGNWVVCNKCDKAFRLAEVNAGGGGCKPVPLAHRARADEIVLAEADILSGWRYFR